ncbi:MAG: M28 family peptidase [Candidatus Zixiibacteriota bacterium]
MSIKRVLLTAFALIVVSAPLMAGDLLRVGVGSEQDAEILRQSGAEPVHRLPGGYLILAEENEIEFLHERGIQTTLEATDVYLDELAIPFRFDHTPDKNKRILFQDGDYIIYQTEASAFAASDDGSIEFLPVEGNQPKIFYSRPKGFYPGFALAEAPLDSLIALVDQDTITAFNERLQAFYRRETGTDSCWAARDWIEQKFFDWGYDSTVVDSFTWGAGNEGQNVYAVKLGSRFPDDIIVVGGHYDAVAVSPGADDNGSGTVGTMEMARILKDIETEMTFVFIAFDAEETGLNGARHYADEAYARGDHIIYMLNMDMIAFDANDTFAKLYYGDELAYSQMWGKLADSLVNITGVLSGSAGNSDHAPFADNGYDVTFVHEYHFSSVYHSSADSTTHMDFDYMKRMIQASLATVYVVNNAPPPVTISNIIDGGDGQSLEVNWTYGDISRIDHYYLHYTTVPATQPDSILVPVDSVSYLVEGLTDGQMYSFYLVAYDVDGRTSIAVDELTATPHSTPVMPTGPSVKPIRDSIVLTWNANNTELDFDHYGIIRDNVLLPVEVTGTTYTDGDPAIGYDLHEYYIVAVDTDDNTSDTTGVGALTMKAAKLERDRILAVNRTTDGGNSLANDSITGAFLKEACTGYFFDYFSDTSSTNPERAGLLNLIDYGTVIIGVEGRNDELGTEFSTQLYNALANYLSIGGKAIIFGRWGDWSLVNKVDTMIYTPLDPDAIYWNYFHTFMRRRPLSLVQNPGPIIVSDFVGAHSKIAGYPELAWDSLVTMQHTGGSFTGVTGIPLPTLPSLVGAAYDTIYTYNSSVDSTLTEGKTIGWRYLGGTYEYVFFDIPLSFMERSSAIQTLRKAIDDLGVSTPVTDTDDGSTLPRTFALGQNYPNPFNPKTTIEFFNPESRPVDVTLEVFNILGQRVALLFDGAAAPGVTVVEWEGKDGSGQTVASGIYFYRLKTELKTETKKMVLLK